MSETNTNPNFRVPATQDFNTESFAGSMQQVLQDNIGKYVIVDFFMGTNTLEQREGYLYDVAGQYIVLFDEINLHYVVCDMFSIKFVTFLLPNYRPGQVPALLEALENARQNMPQDAETTSAGVTPAQAAFNYATRSKRR
ncbi:MAG: hypothetical protein E7316_04195 [Clostridiales bacterium]|nr:hypothetical protein [Clostridiales bacterium]